VAEVLRNKQTGCDEEDDSRNGKYDGDGEKAQPYSETRFAPGRLGAWVTRLIARRVARLLVAARLSAITAGSVPGLGVALGRVVLLAIGLLPIARCGVPRLPVRLRGVVLLAV
jgi:hypothetical protein